ncbi:hypothetical protein LJC32_00875 [Oscillospiraceae bacterium OttesenSCG-928-F05]|nr:hypothetical protein [Oscillospiraceae bacterium OttesenSCG-928-F05]
MDEAKYYHERKEGFSLENNILTDENICAALNARPRFKWDEDVLKLFEPDYKPENYSITGNGIKYMHIPDTEKFCIEGIQHELTALQVMKAIFPQTKSLYRRIIPPDKYFNFGDSTRFKIMKAFQAHTFLPPVTEETQQFTEFFKTLSTNVQGHWTVQQQYNAARFATQYEDDLAASLLLHYGWTPRVKPPMRGASMHKLTITDDGILVDMTYTHTFQERFEAACSAAKLTVEDMQRRELPQENSYYLSMALKQFYLFKDKFISINNEYAQSVKAKLTYFIDDLINATGNGTPDYPTIDEPDNILEDDVFLLKWDDFRLHPNDAMKEQRRNNNKQVVLETLRSKIGWLPNGVIFKRAELIPFLSDPNLKSGYTYDFLLKPKDDNGNEKQGYYILNLPDEAEEDEG